MSHFYGNMQGSRGETTRCGTKFSGHFCHIRGWDSGIKVIATYNHELERDEFVVYTTGGSNHSNMNPIGVLVDGKWEARG